jgi:hypothetical protein
MKASDQIINWLNTHDLIKIKALEEKCGLPQSCIARVNAGKINLPPHHVPALMKELKKYGLVIKEEQT